MKFNFRYFAAFIIILSVEILIALFVHDGFVRPYLGDVIVVWLIYCFVRIFSTNKITALPLYVFLFAVSVEILQYFNIVELLRLEGNALARTVIGTSFSFIDIACYFVGALILFIWQTVESKLTKKNI